MASGTGSFCWSLLLVGFGRVMKNFKYQIQEKEVLEINTELDGERVPSETNRVL